MTTPATNNQAPDGSTRVTVVNVDTPVELTGDIGVDQLDDIVTATEASAVADAAIALATGAQADSAATNTIIGLLKRIAIGVEALA